MVHRRALMSQKGLAKMDATWNGWSSERIEHHLFNFLLHLLGIISMGLGPSNSSTIGFYEVCS